MGKTGDGRALHMLSKCGTTEWFCLFMCLYLRQVVKVHRLGTPASGPGGLGYSLCHHLRYLVRVSVAVKRLRDCTAPIKGNIPSW